MSEEFPSVLATRYAGRTMAALFTPRARALAFRDVWIALAEAEHELGAPVTRAQVDALRRSREVIDLERVAAIEAETRHDVMAHVKAWGEACPDAAGIIHLGATSQDVNDNADALVERRALIAIRDRLVRLGRALRDFAVKHAGSAALGYTHFQPAQPVTVGKRAAMWLQDVMWDVEAVQRELLNARCRGLKGTTGTQASFLELLGTADKVRDLDTCFAEKLGFASTLPITGQTTPRKLDVRLGDLLAGIAVSVAKLGVDARLLAHTNELREAMGRGQVGSSAMPYKRNPMKAERLCSIARLVPAMREVLVQTAMNQWLERTLDDSAARRVTVPDLFLATDGALRVAIDLVVGLEVDDIEIARRLQDEAPFLMVERLLALGVRAGGDRQRLHEALRTHAMEARSSNDPPSRFWELVVEDALIPGADPKALHELLTNPAPLTGLAEEQVRRYVDTIVDPMLARFSVSDADDPLTV